MKGQWLGTYSGSRSGVITLNMDEGYENYTGYAHLVDGADSVPITLAGLVSKDKNNPCELEAQIIQVDADTHNSLSPEFLASKFPGAIFPKTAKVKATISGRNIDLEWETDISTKGSATLTGGTCEDKSDYAPKELSWAEFKAHVGTFPARKFIFRGQEKPWKLRTSFHRTGRADVLVFQQRDIPVLYRALSSRTKHLYNLNDGDQNGSFWHLAQHHGYPTPLLDWSYSPFVAAFCAYRKTNPKDAAPDDKVRIFMFDHVTWHATGHWERLQTMRTHKRHVSVLEFIAMDNERMIPQQALSMVTNIDDVESYIREREHVKQTTYLQVFDLPAYERHTAMADLSLMGITAGSMFPGLDGMCEEIKERMFITGR
jgi:hypothetical protein